MRRHFLITMICMFFAATFLACDNNAAKNFHESNKVKATSDVEESADKQVQGGIRGIELITDEQFKRELLEYLAFDTKLDYINIYRYLSKAFLKRYFSNIKNAEEYKTRMETKSERGYPKYLEITTWKELKKDNYQVELIFETNAEGEMIKIKALYYFVNENGKWKFDSRKLISYLELEKGDKTWKAY